MVSPNEKSKVLNLCSFPVSWERSTLAGDEYLKSHASTYIANSEIQTQIENGNKFIGGIDGNGSHADVYIDNAELREQYGFDNKTENKKQLIIDDEKCEYILGLKTLSAFKKNLESNIVTVSEKMKIMEFARKNKLNEFDKVEALEEYTGLKYKPE